MSCCSVFPNEQQITGRILLNNSSSNCNNNKLDSTDLDLSFIRVLQILLCFQEMENTLPPVALMNRLLKWRTTKTTTTQTKITKSNNNKKDNTNNNIIIINNNNNNTNNNNNNVNKTAITTKQVTASETHEQQQQITITVMTICRITQLTTTISNSLQLPYTWRWWCGKPILINSTTAKVEFRTT